MKTMKLLSFLASSFLASSSFAATTWTMSQFLDGSNVATLQAKNVTAWSSTGSGGALATACIHNYSGNYGIVNTAEATPCTNEPGTGPHAADNAVGTDMFLLEFSAPVSLTQVSIGWNGTDDKIWNGTSWVYADSDISVLAYTAASGGPNVVGKTLSGLLTSGWSVVGNYADVGDYSGNKVSVNNENDPNAPVSSWWLVSAYSSVFGAKGPNIGSPFGDGNDYFKLLSVAGNIHTPNNETPEPGAIFLFGAGLFGLMALRRRRQIKH